MTMGRYLAVEPIVFFIFMKKMSSISELQEKIRKHYSWYSINVTIDTKLWFTDKARKTQNFFVALWNALWGLSLVNWDFITENLPYIDLIDEKNGIVIQVTVDKSRVKLKDTLDWFVSKYLGKYKKLKMWYIGEKKQNFTKLEEFDTYKDFFDINEDLIYDQDFYKQIEMIQDPRKLIKILKILSDFYEPIDTMRMDFKEISKALNLIKNSLTELGIFLKWDLLNPNNNRIEDIDFMDKKDTINEVSPNNYENWVLLDSKIMELLWQDDDLRETYDDIISSIKSLWDVNKILEIFTRVLSRIPYEDESNRKICWTILENMYFNCDIGKNPDVTSW